MLFELLAHSSDLWSIGAEAHAVIEGVPTLHPRACGFDSHELTAQHADRSTVRRLRCAFLAHLHDSSGRSYLDLGSAARSQPFRLLEKTPENALRVRFLRAAFPDAQFIHLVREARQNISSMVTAWRHAGFVSIPNLPGWNGGDWHLLLPRGWRELRGKSLTELAAFQWATANEAIMEGLAAGPASSWISVDYDELVSAPVDVVQRICAFLDVPIRGALEAVLRRPIPVAPTTLTPPSPMKWRYNRDFDESALRLVEPTIRRVDRVRGAVA
jgi:hypothetical protein